MKIRLVMLIGTMGLTSQLAFAQGAELATSESRDAATAFVGSMQFTVGRIGRDCLAPLDRKETPQEFANAWQQRNSKYVNSVTEYLQARLGEAEAKGKSAKNSLMRELAAIRSNAEADINSLYAKNGKESVCKRMIMLIESGAYDITSRVPMFNELEALVVWSQKQ